MPVSGGLNPLASCDDRFFRTYWTVAGNATIRAQYRPLGSENGNSSRFPATRRPASSELATNVKDQTAFGSTVILF